MKQLLQIHELGELFERVQLNSVFIDGKTFVDCVPKRNLAVIQKEYETIKGDSGFDLKNFVQANFDLPTAPSISFHSDSSKSAAQHINDLWDFLTRTPTKEERLAAHHHHHRVHSVEPD